MVERLKIFYFLIVLKKRKNIDKDIDRLRGKLTLAHFFNVRFA